MARFTIPRDIYFGRGALGELRALQGRKRAFLVTGGSAMQKHGFLDRISDYLRSLGCELHLFEGVEPDPSVETVLRGAAEMRAFEPDVIVALGGGSPMDAAKAMWVFYEYPERTFEGLKNPFTLPKLRQKAIFVAIPSTSGSASEVTAFSVITDYETRVKYPLADFEITPDIAILDPELAEAMPPELAAHTGLDALTHALEALVATNRSPFTDPLALEAVSLIFDHLRDSCAGDAEAREGMHIAQCLAGLAFSNALLGITHSLAHKVGAQFELSHGCCNAVLLPYVIRYNARDVAPLYALAARRLGLPGGTDKQLTDSLISAIARLAADVGVKPDFQSYGVPEERFLEKRAFIAKEASLDPCTLSNPRHADADELAELLTCAYYGRPITF